MHDFFISYTQADRTWAEWIAWQLEAEGYTTILQAWDIRPGANFALAMQRAAAEAERTIAVLSPAYLASRFTQPEWAAAFTQDPTGELGLLVPVRVGDCDLQGLLPQIVYIDLVGLDEADAKVALLSGVQRGRAKPEGAPGFPGAASGAVRMGQEQPAFPGLEPDWDFGDYSSNRGWVAEAVMIERHPHYRQDVVERLRSERFGQRYRRMLNSILALAERIWGPRGSWQAFITCVFFSLVYSYVLFWFNMIGRWENPFGHAAGFGKVSALGWTQRWLLFGFAVVSPVSVWLLGRWLGIVEKYYKTFQRRKRPSWSRRRWTDFYDTICGTIACTIVIGFIWASVRVESSDVIGGVTNFISVIILFSSGPIIIGIAWGGRSRNPWQALFITGTFAISAVFVAEFSKDFGLAFASSISEAFLVASSGSIAISFSSIMAFTGYVIFSFSGAVGFAFAVGFAVVGSGSVMSSRKNLKSVNLFSTIMASFIAWALAGLMVERSERGIFSYFVISMLIFPVINGGLDYVSLWITRILGHDLKYNLSNISGVVVTLIRSHVHIITDLFFALGFFIAMAFALGFAFESYDQYANLTVFASFRELSSGPGGYAATLRDDPLGEGLWITLMLLTTLIPTVIHFGMVVGAFLPATLLPDARRRQLASDLADLGQMPPSDAVAREHWAATIRDSAKFAAGYRWRMAWGYMLTCGLLAALFWGLGQLYPHLFLTEWAYQGGVLGIKTARWLLGGL